MTALIVVIFVAVYLGMALKTRRLEMNPEPAAAHLSSSRSTLASTRSLLSNPSANQP
jgi:hypothetical protein